MNIIINILIAFILTIIIGLSAFVGSFIGTCFNKLGFFLTSVFLGFSGGVIIFANIIIFSNQFYTFPIDFRGSLSDIIKYGIIGCLPLVGLFFYTNIKYTIINFFKEDDSLENFDDLNKTARIYQLVTDTYNPENILLAGLISIVGISIQNLYEGVSIYNKILAMPSDKFNIVISCSVLTIFEGFALYMPIYMTTSNKNKAFMYSFIPGLFIPFGVLIKPLFFNNNIFAIAGFIICCFATCSALNLIPFAKDDYNYRNNITLEGVLGGFVGVFLSYYIWSSFLL